MLNLNYKMRKPLFFPADYSRPIVCYIDGYFKRVFWKEVFYVLWPLHNTWASAVKVVIETNVKGLGVFGYSIEVKMKNAFSIVSNVLVYDRECRRRYFFPWNAKTLANGLRERGFSCSHRSIESYERVSFYHLFESGSSICDAIKAANC